jgi:hypothetical protein
VTAKKALGSATLVSIAVVRHGELLVNQNHISSPALGLPSTAYQNEFLSAPPRLHFSRVQVPFGIGDDFVHVMELACIPTGVPRASEDSAIAAA